MPLLFFVLCGNGKLDVRFIHGRAKKSIRNYAHILDQNLQGNNVTRIFGEKDLFICRHIYLCK